MNQHDRKTDLVRHLPLGGFGNIVSNDVVGSVLLGDLVLVEVFDGVSVVESHERSLGRNEVGVEGLDHLGGDRVGEKNVDNLADLSKSAQPYSDEIV